MSYPSTLHPSTQIQTGTKLIGIHGHAGSGKDTVAKYLSSSRSDTYWLAFAEPLKDACAAMFGISREFFDDSAMKEIEHPFWKVSPRKIAQFVGTEMVRSHLHHLFGLSEFQHSDDFWIRHVAGIINGHLDNRAEYLEDDVVCISDVRFQNEYDWIIANDGIIIHLTREGAEGKVGLKDHASEKSLKYYTPERTYNVENNGTLEELYGKIDKIVNDSGIYPFHSVDQF